MIMAHPKSAKDAVSGSLWSAITAPNRPAEWTLSDLAAWSQMSRTTVGKIVRDWVKVGAVVQLTKPTPAGPAIYRTVRTSSTPPTFIQGGPTRNMWTAMRGLRTFTALDLSAHATTSEVNVTERMADEYCSALLGAGFVICERKAVIGRNAAIYRLVKNSGPRPPVVRRVSAVFDPNTDTTVLLKVGKK